MFEVRTIDEAQEFFLRNSDGSCLVIRENGESKECDCYPDAAAFLKS